MATEDRRDVATDGGHVVRDDVGIETALLETIHDLDDGTQGAPVGEVVGRVLERTSVRLDVLYDALRRAYGRGLISQPAGLRRLVPAADWEGRPDVE